MGANVLPFVLLSCLFLVVIGLGQATSQLRVEDWMATDPNHFECANPILRVEDMAAAVRYYVDVLGFKNAPWGNEYFTSVNRDRAGIYLCKGSQGHVGGWAWVGVEDIANLHQELTARNAKIRHAPRNYPWALEFHVEDPDGNVLRFGSEPDENRPWDEWLD